MSQNFSDIIDRCGEPIWYDTFDYPRYCEFHPSRVAQIESIAVALLQVECYHCHAQFLIAKSMQRYLLTDVEPSQYPDPKNLGRFAIGRPPFHNCNGDTSNFDIRAVVQFWRRNKETKYHIWERLSEYEFSI